MKKLIGKFTRLDLRKNAAKVIKIQIKYSTVKHSPKEWRKDNMKIISTVYQYVILTGLDDWLGWKKEKESGLTCPDREAHMEEEKQWYTQEQIRQLNADFNYENYEQFYEKADEEEGEDGSGPDDNHVSESEGSSVPGGQESSRDKKQKKKKKKSDNAKKLKEEEDGKGFDGAVSESNILYQMESKVKLDPHFMENYEQWLEDEVWSYFD